MGDFNEFDDDIREVTPQGVKEPEMEHLPMTGSPEWRDLAKESAQLKMVEHTYLTPPDRMPEMSYIGRHEANNLASMMMFDAMSQPDYESGTAFKLWLRYFLSLRRSVGGRHLGKAYQLAEAGMLTSDKEASGMAMELE